MGSDRPGRRIGIAAAVLLMAAMAAIALLGLLPHSSRAAAQPASASVSRHMTVRQILGRVRHATRTAPVFVFHQTGSPGLGMKRTTADIDMRRHIAVVRAGRIEAIAVGGRLYTRGIHGRTCWTDSRLDWKRVFASDNAWEVLAGFNAPAGAHAHAAGLTLSAAANLGVPGGTPSWSVTTLTYGRSWRATRQFMRVNARRRTSGGSTGWQSLSYPATLPIRITQPTRDFCARKHGSASEGTTGSSTRATLATPGAATRTGAAMRTEASTRTPAQPLAGKIVGIDPGHNGRNWSDPSYINRLIWNGRERETCDTTGTETDGGYTEAQFNFNVAQDVAADLRAKGAKVVLTRQNNHGVGPCVTERAAIFRRAHVDVGLSIHGDGGPADGRGFAVLGPVKDGINNRVIGSSWRFDRTLARTFHAVVKMPYSTYDGKNGLDARDNLAGENLARYPYGLIECGNMRNVTDARLMVKSWWQKRAARGIADAITRFLTAHS